ncbi:MAG TPA: VOC family protein, partial [Casimicrobiaceae bacterium]
MISRHPVPPELTLDHLVVAATSLDAGADWIEARLGVRPVPGGKHATMGTHNALVGLGPGAYLEVIAIDPQASAPARARWFDL